MKNTKDQNIISLLHTNAEEGMSLLMEEYMGLLWSACRLYLDNPEDIRECVQDTLLDFYEHLNRFDTNKGTLKAYLYVIAKRKAMHMASKNGIYIEEMSDDMMTDGEDWVEQVVDQTTLETALAKLKEQDSQMIRMKYYNGMTSAEIAHELNLPVETVKKRQQRNLKKLRRILVAILILGLLSACAVTVIYRYRFSSITGIQQNEGGTWCVMADAPMHLDTERGEVIIDQVIWKEGKIIAEFWFMDLISTDPELSNLEMSIQEIMEKGLLHEELNVIICSENLSRLGTANPRITDWFDDSPAIWFHGEFDYEEPTETVSFEILGAIYTVNMQPIEGYESLKDIGESQTHNGRTIVLKKENEGEKEELKVYTYSEDIWKITHMGKWPIPEWISSRFTDSTVYTLNEDISELKSVEIGTLGLTAECEDVKFSLTIPEDHAEVDIPFSVGEDVYRITEIDVSHGTYEYILTDENNEETIEYGDEIFMKVESVEIEEGTEVIGMAATLGVEEEILASVFQRDTGKTEIQSMGTRFNYISDNLFDSFFWDENFQPTEPVLHFKFHKGEEIPKEVVLRIDEVTKFWNQEYRFQLK